MRNTTTGMVFLSMLLSGAIFGFFYAWVCSTMWGLDAADPRVAIAAMQAMNASVRNVVFAPAFFGTPFALLLTSGLLLRDGFRGGALGFSLGGVIYLCCGMVLTMIVNVPMNEVLAGVTVPEDIEAARHIWAEYSGPWQVWNQIRTTASGIALLATIGGLISMVPFRRKTTSYPDRNGPR